MPIPKPEPNENKDTFIIRCMANSKMRQEYPNSQLYAICESQFTTLAKQNISFDYDDTLSTKKGTDLAKELIKNNTLYIISARNDKSGMIEKAKQIGIPLDNVYATGSNKAKIDKVKELNISKHYDNNIDVVNALKGIGIKF